MAHSYDSRRPGRAAAWRTSACGVPPGAESTGRPHRVPVTYCWEFVLRVLIGERAPTALMTADRGHGPVLRAPSSLRWRGRC